MRFLKYSLLAAGVLVLLLTAAVAYLVLTFDPQDYEPRLAAFVKEKTGRTLTIQGKTRLSFWPDLAVELGPARLSERGDASAFAEVEDVRFVAMLRPLLSKQLVVKELHLAGASVRVVRFADGRLNIDDLLGGESGALDYDVAKVRVERSRIVYEDVRSGARHEMTQINLTSGRVAPHVATPISLSFTAADAAHTYSVASRMEAIVASDSASRTYALDKVTARVSGAIAGVNDLQAKADIAAIAITAGAVDAKNVSAEVLGNAWRVRLATTQLGWREGVLRAAVAKLDFDGTHQSRQMVATIVGDLSAAMAEQKIDLAETRAHFALTGAGLPTKGIEGELAGAAAVDAKEGRALANVTGIVHGSRVKAKLAADRSATAPYTFDIAVDDFDLDRFAASPNTGKPSAGFDVSSLSNVGAAGVLRVGTLKTAGAVARNVRLSFKP